MHSTHSTHSRRTALASAGLVLALIAGSALLAHAVSYTGPTTTLSDAYTSTTGVTYTFGTFTNGNGEMATGAAITFPAGTSVSGATAVSPAGTVSISGQTVTITFATPVGRGAEYSVSIGGITNPSSSGVYNAGSLTIFLANPANNNVRDPQDLPTGDYTIGTRVLTLSVSPTSVDFDLQPDVASPVHDVTVSVTSSHSYMITRDITPDAASFGLDVTGDASGPKSDGTAALVDQYQATAPWTTPGDATYTATVTYTVVQD
ncbi:MAG: hypothetical protein Q7W44_05700 [Coriobacteriia bacterium]|nr:hypothetical protein [Coriobacteriia bacterium]